MAVSPSLVLSTLMALLLVAIVGWLVRFERRWAVPSGAAPGAGSYLTVGREGKLTGLSRWLTTVDHRDIGLMYGVFATVMLAAGGLAAVFMRIELLTPGADVFSRQVYNALFTVHGVTMLFLFATPMIGAFVNYVLPRLVGADDMAFPRVNAVAFWLLPPSALLIWGGFILAPFGLGVSPAATGWTLYTPLSVQLQNHGVDLLLLGFHLSGVSTILSGINFMTTIVAKRDVSIGWADLDIFSWTVLTQAGIILFAFPVVGAAVVMLLLDRNFGTTFFAPHPVGGGPLLFQHLFWFFGHPEVYILVLPPMGLVSYILPKFSGRELFGFRFVVYSTLAIGVLSFGVWAHHMFTTGLDPRLQTSFMAVSLAIAVPSAVKVFNWIATLWSGRIRLTVPMLFCLGFVQNFIIGGVTGVFLAAIPFDYIMQDTYYVVGHFHFIVYGAIGFALFAASYYWFPLITGRMYNRTLGRWHFWLSIIGGNVSFFAMIVLGYDGMPRRYATYLPRYATLHQIATVGAFLMAIGGAFWLWNMVQSMRTGPVVDRDDPWGLGADVKHTREWTWYSDVRRRPPVAVTDGRGDAPGDDRGR